MASTGKLSSRKVLEQRFAGIYMPFKPPGNWREHCCCYCGNHAQGRDHIPPMSWLYALGSSWFESKAILLVWVPSCTECNSLLGHLNLFTVYDRTEYLLGRYMARYKRLLGMPKWEQFELYELQGRLREYVERSEQYRAGIARRIGIIAENCRVRSVSEFVSSD